MSTASQTFWVVRRGHRPEEYEDAFASDDAAGRYAVADGATESCFAGLWARLLVEGFLRGDRGRPDHSPASLAALQDQWCMAVRARQLSWYSEPAIERGAFATFLGLTVHADRQSGYRWQAAAVGDTCLFCTRGDELLQAFPLERAEQFDNVPKLIGSRMSTEALRQRRRVWADGAGHAGDRLWMVTDALAQWCLAENEAGRTPWPALLAILADLEPADRFASWIEGLRDAGQLRNDDVTLLAIALEKPQPEPHSAAANAAATVLAPDP
jgi:hypothetical protein